MFFQPKSIFSNNLPTNRDVIQYLIHLKQNGTFNVPKNRKLISYSPEVIKNLIAIWSRANIPLVGRLTIRKYINLIIEDYYFVIKNPTKYKDEEWNRLFRISVCKCGIDLGEICTCSNITKIPENVRNFFLDQCDSRQLLLPVNKVCETEFEERPRAVTVTSYAQSTFSYTPSNTSEEELENTLNEKSELLPKGLKISDLNLQNYCSALDRTDTSNRAGSLLATMLVKDIRNAIADKAMQNNLENDITAKFIRFIDGIIIDKSKIFRERTKFRNKSLKAANVETAIECISFDGKKDLSLKKQTVLNSVRLCQVYEEHVTIVKEPGSKFIGYVTPTTGTGEGIQKAITDFFINQNYSLEDVVAFSCDGTATNTGHRNGVIPFMERYLQRPLQWCICLFHFNELPMSALLRNFFGKQNGPGLWPTEFGKELMECDKYSIAENFKPISMGDMPENIDDWTIRADQRYLYRMVMAVNDGICSENLASIKAGPLSTARWLTTASRILRLYVSKNHPSAHLEKLVEFVVKLYAPFWFLVKKQPEAIHGSRNVYQYLRWMRCLPLEMQLIIQPVIENNAYYFHPENVFLSMITEAESEDAATIREDAYAKIISSRIDPPLSLRKFYVPRGSINFSSDSYVDMINWSKFQITEPPCLQFRTQEELQEYHYSNEIIKIPDILCHTQNTERFVHVVSESSLAVSDTERLGHIFAKLDSRERYSVIESRRDLL